MSNIYLILNSKVYVLNVLLTLFCCSKDQYGLHSDQWPGHPDGINTMISITDNVVITGCEDGHIRAAHLYPHRFLGVVGHHDQELPVERMDVSSSGEVVASISHDNRWVKLFSLDLILCCFNTLFGLGH